MLTQLHDVPEKNKKKPHIKKVPLNALYLNDYIGTEGVTFRGTFTREDIRIDANPWFISTPIIDGE